MGDMAEMYRDLREARREERARLGVDCPGCRKARPKASPTRLMPGRRCRVCGTDYETAKRQADTRPHRSPKAGLAMGRRMVEEIVYGIDEGSKEVTDWEADFLDGIMKRLEHPTWTPSPKQAQKLLDLKEIYL